MATVIQERSKITAKGQTTVPKAVRQVLGVSYGGEIAFVVDDRGVSVQRVEAEEADPVIAAFLGFLEQDMLGNPNNVVAIPRSLAGRMAALTEQVDVDLDHDIDGPVAL
jgi:antitoxin PrlF